MPGEAAFDIDGLDEGLAELAQHAERLDVLVKGGFVPNSKPGGTGGDVNNIEASGHIDEDGREGGNRGSMGDAGTVEDLMIGKLLAGGADAGFVAQFQEFLGKASEEEEDPEDDDEEEMEAKLTEMHGAMKAYMKAHGSLKGFPPFGLRDEAKKSMPTAGERLRKSLTNKLPDAVNAEPLMRELVSGFSSSLDNLDLSLRKSQALSAKGTQLTGAAIAQMGSLLKSQAGVIAELSKRLGIVEAQPMPQRGVTRLSDVRALNKGMPGEAGAPAPMQLRKSEVAAVLSYMNLEKGIRTIGAGIRTSDEIGSIESVGDVSKEAFEAATQFLARNPAEAELALKYS